MVYQMATGRYPFEGATEYIIFEKIKNFDITFPDVFIFPLFFCNKK